MYRGSSIIALCIPKAYEHTEFVAELNESLLEYGYRLVIYHTCSDLYWNTESDMVEKTVFDLIDFDVIDAIVIYEEFYHDKQALQEVAARAELHNKPIITVGAESSRHINIVLDDERGFELVVRHVIEEHDCSNPHLIAGFQGEYHSENRIKVFKKVLRENDISFTDDMLSYGDYWFGPVRDVVNSLIEREKMPDAIICVNDTTAITACNELQGHGISVPQDVIITGFDGIREAQYCTPPITTCHYDLPALVQEIVKNIRLALQGQIVEGIHSVDFVLDIFSSCGCERKIPLPNFGQIARENEDAFYGYFEMQRKLYELTEKAVACNDAEEIAERLRQVDFGNCMIFLKQTYFDNKINPLVKSEELDQDDSLCVLYTPDEESIPLFSVCKENDMTPCWDILIRENRPLVLTVLGFWSNSLGFIASYFQMVEHEYRKINQYIAAINILLGCNQNVRYIKYTADYMEEMAKHDAMTKLYNRKGFYAALPDLVRCAIDRGMLLAVVSMDADNLKYVNDTLGHENGDYVICSAANALRGLALPHAIYGRFGGDEFAACIAIDRDVGEENVISMIQERIRLIDENHDKSFSISVSIGVQKCVPDDFDFDSAYNQADIKMYADKKTKRKKA